MTTRCRLCNQMIQAMPLSLGSLPVCNAFDRNRSTTRTIDLDIIECETCQLVQLGRVAAPELLMPAVPWIRYREPEGHLDDLVASLLSLHPGARRACGTGPFEQPLLSRLDARGLQTQALTLETTAPAGRHPYLESWQAILNADHLAAATARSGTFDLVSCRYIVEHSPAPVLALRAMRHLLAPDGLLLVEVPDSSKFLAACDYCFLWEEHSSYFVEPTLRRLAEMSGYHVVSLLRYPGALEDALVAILQPAMSPTAMISPLGSTGLFQTYRQAFAGRRETVQSRLRAAARPDGDGVALFGIGHHAIMFVNAFGVGNRIALAVDDDSDKAGFFPPGFEVPVVGSDRLLADEHVTLCLFAVAPHIEGKVRAKLAPLAARGVEFRSIYAALDNAIFKDNAP
uniref:class I SAM-dependent methyltransferase n=1 Tax=Bradyrhizobium sp. (strain ORS 278) TaxID=114615 RepID=UPI0012FE94E8|nr:class I SAM-dependent methyltransferase [Bradyrhizobium sp. ORS 278]